MPLGIYSNFDFAGNGIKATAAKNSTTNIDFKVTVDNIFINGGLILYKNANWGDYITAQVVDIDNVLGYGANLVLQEYITKWYVHPDDKELKILLDYAGKIPINTYLRIKYTSTGVVTDVDIAVNYALHKLE